MERKVWHWLNLEAISIYSQNCDTLEVGESPILKACFAEDFSLTGTRELKRREISGSLKPKIVPRGGFIYSGSISGLFFRKSTELDPATILAQCSCLAIKFSLINADYSGSAPFENDTLWLKEAKVREFQITGSDNEIIKSTLSFDARTFE